MKRSPDSVDTAPFNGLVFALMVAIGSGAPLQAEETSANTRSSSAMLDAGHSIHGESFDEGPRQAAYLMHGMSNVRWDVSTPAPMAQRFFDQGPDSFMAFGILKPSDPSDKLPLSTPTARWHIGGWLEPTY